LPNRKNVLRMDEAGARFQEASGNTAANTGPIAAVKHRHTVKTAAAETIRHTAEPAAATQRHTAEPAAVAHRHTVEPAAVAHRHTVEPAVVAPVPVPAVDGALLDPAPEQWVFALDIGTRTIMGVVGEERGDRIEVLAVHVLEHDQRAMLDGQIHDIAKVAAGARRVKEALEARLGRRLVKVAVAAAGRVLKTCQVSVTREVDESLEIDAQLVGALEMEGIRRAQEQIAAELPDNGRNPFYCVGYSVIHYHVNDLPISNLIGHRGTHIGADLLATFLPHMVVDSLHTVMDRIGLQVASMTLEPIAALNVAIPRDLRMLNLALVDVGAGTSDIAITRGGTVVGYAMAPYAGDEVTEAIAQQYLVDFQTAERIKLSLGDADGEIAFLDILDNQVVVPVGAVLDVIRPVVENLARTIAERVIACNGGKSPNAIFLVGGGSQTPELARTLSGIMGLPAERVAVRNRAIARNIVYDGSELQGPESITPFGILTTAFQQAGRDFYHVYVEDRQIRLYNARRMAVSDALLLAGYVPDQLIGKSGRSMTITLNGMEKVIRGGFGKPAIIGRNGQPAGLTTTVEPGDRISVCEAERGADAVSVAGDHAAACQPVVLVLAGTRYQVPGRLLCNGKAVEPQTPLQDGDSLVVEPPGTVAEMAAVFELDPEAFTFRRDGRRLSPMDALAPGDVVVCRPQAQADDAAAVAETEAIGEPARPGEPASHEESDDSGEPASQGKSASLEEPASPVESARPDEPVRPEDSVAAVDALSQAMPPVAADAAPAPAAVPSPGPVAPRPAAEPDVVITVNGDTVRLPATGGSHMFVDVFTQYPFDLTNPQGTIGLRLNGRDAGFTDPIKTGDSLEIVWRE